MLLSMSRNGYIEYQINENESLRIWDDGLPEIAIQRIHDHTDNFTVRVCTGVLVVGVFDFAPNQQGDSVLWGTQPWLDGDDAPHPLPGMKGDLTAFEAGIYKAGYQFQYRSPWFHEVGHQGFTVAHVITTQRGVTAASRFVAAASELSKAFLFEPVSVATMMEYVERARPYVAGDTLYA